MSEGRCGHGETEQRGLSQRATGQHRHQHQHHQPLAHHSGHRSLRKSRPPPSQPYWATPSAVSRAHLHPPRSPSYWRALRSDHQYIADSLTSSLGPSALQGCADSPAAQSTLALGLCWRGVLLPPDGLESGCRGRSGSDGVSPCYALCVHGRARRCRELAVRSLSRADWIPGVKCMGVRGLSVAVVELVVRGVFRIRNHKPLQGRSSKCGMSKTHGSAVSLENQCYLQEKDCGTCASSLQGPRSKYQIEQTGGEKAEIPLCMLFGREILTNRTIHFPTQATGQTRLNPHNPTPFTSPSLTPLTCPSTTSPSITSPPLPNIKCSTFTFGPLNHLLASITHQTTAPSIGAP